jgi:alkylation response protein AidB-like acyl-CoA dehydrogenase
MNVVDAVSLALGVREPSAGAVVWGAISSGSPADAGIEAEAVGRTWQLSGTVDTVLWPDATQSLLVISRSRPFAGRDRGMRVHRVPCTAPGVTIAERPLLAFDARSVHFDGVEVHDADAIGPARDASAALAAAFDQLCIAAVDLMLREAEAALAAAVEWVSAREQFGAPLAARQAVQHRAANMAIDCAAVRGLVEAAHEASARGRCTVEAATAKLLANERLPEVTASAHQLHGGEGYYADRDLHLHHRRVCTLAALFGNASRQRARLALLLEDPHPRSGE